MFADASPSVRIPFTSARLDAGYPDRGGGTMHEAIASQAEVFPADPEDTLEDPDGDGDDSEETADDDEIGSD